MEGAEAGAAVAAAAAAPDTDGVQVMEEGNWNQCCLLLCLFCPCFTDSLCISVHIHCYNEYNLYLVAKLLQFFFHHFGSSHIMTVSSLFFF